MFTNEYVHQQNKVEMAMAGHLAQTTKALNVFRVLISVAILLFAYNSFAAQGSRQLRDEIESDIYDVMDTYRVSSLAVAIVKDQDIILSRGFGIESDGKRLPITRTTQMDMHAATKLLSALTVLSLYERGLLDINSPIGDLADDLPESWQSIPFWRLLNHTSGIPTVVDKAEFEQLSEKSGTTDRDLLNIIKKLPLDYPPGRYFRYRESGYAVASVIAAEHLHMTWPEIVDKYVTGPAGMERTAHRDIAGQGNTNPMLAAAGGYLTTPEDMARLFRALNADKIVSSATLKKEMFNPERTVDHYSLGAIVENYGDIATLGHRGGGAQANIRYAPDAKVGVAVFTDQGDSYEITIELADKIMKRLLLEQPLKRSKQPIAIRLADYRDQPPETIMSFYEDAWAKHRDKYDFSQAELALNSLGYYLLGNQVLGSDAVDNAIAIFKFNTRQFPNSANAYDSLGEAYLKRGDIEKARVNYQKSLELDPENQNAVDALRKMEER